MIFRGDRLREILANQKESLDFRNVFGFTEGLRQTTRTALSALHQSGDRYFGVGNKNRIRFIQPETPEDAVFRFMSSKELAAFVAPRRMPTVTKNRTAPGAKRWKPQLNRAVSSQQCGRGQNTSL